MSTEQTLEKELENIYLEATIKLTEITERHKKEIDAYISKLKDERIEKIKEEIKA